MTLAPGATMGPYRILEQIGRGGMATVYKAYQAALARNVAIKVLPAFFAEEEGFRERFQQEAIAVAKLRHPNVLAVFDYGEEGGVTYIVSEFVDGGTLAEQVGQPLPVDYVVRILSPIASALDYAHSRGVLHRDVKPSNILLERDGTPILSDFGLAKMIGSLPRLTRTGTTVGTPEYMAPEQGEGEAVGPPADHYALAVIAYEMLTGRVPFTADTPLAVLLAHMHKPLPLPRAVNPAIPPGVEAVLLKGLAKPPGDRYPTASQFVSELAAAAARAPVAAAAPPSAAGPAEAVSAAPAWTVRAIRLTPVGIGAIALVLLLAGGGIALIFAAPGAKPVEQRAPSAATAQAAAATGQTSLSALPKGKLIYQAKLDGSSADLSITNNPENVIRLQPGSIEVGTPRSGQASAAFLLPEPKRAEYVAELDLLFPTDWKADFGLLLRSSETNAGYWLNFNRGPTDVDKVFVLQYEAPGARPDNLTPTPVPVRAGRTFTLGVAVETSRFTVFIDGQQVVQASDSRVTVPYHQPGFRVRFPPGGTGGTIKIVGAHYYELAR